MKIYTPKEIEELKKINDHLKDKSFKLSKKSFDISYLKDKDIEGKNKDLMSKYLGNIEFNDEDLKDIYERSDSEKLKSMSKELFDKNTENIK